MADTTPKKKINELPEATTVNDTDIMITQTTNSTPKTNKITMNTLLNKVKTWLLGVAPFSYVKNLTSDVQTQINQVNSNLQYELLSMGTYAVNRIGDIKSMFYSRAADATMTTTDSYLLYTLPAQYRPKFTFETVSFIRPGVHAVIRVGIDGTVTLSKLSSQVIAGLYVFFHITFI